MPTNYPGGTDAFSEPSLPENTTLSSSGSGTRNHTEHHRDLGDAIEAIQAHAAQKTHNHNGGTGATGGPKLVQANTHESADTDASDSSIHHTIGTGAHQAAAGNHTHDYTGASITNQPFFNCTSVTRPSDPVLGTRIWEHDTNVERAWAQFPDAVAPEWRLLNGGVIPVVRLRQNQNQQINPNGTYLEWHHELEDPLNYFSSSAKTDIVIKDSGLYHIDCAIQWDAQQVSDRVDVILTLDGLETDVRTQQWVRGGLLVPGFSQTVSVSGKLRIASGTILRVLAKHNKNSWINSFFDSNTKVSSRFDLVFLRP